MHPYEWTEDGMLVITFSRTYEAGAELTDRLAKEFREGHSIMRPIEIPESFQQLMFQYHPGRQPRGSMEPHHLYHLALVISVVLRQMGLE